MTENEPITLSLPWWRQPIVLAVCAGVLIVAAVVTTVIVLNRDDSSSSSTDTVEPAALVAARQEAVGFFTLDYRHPEDDVAGVLELATGTFKTEYDKNKAQVIAQVKAKKLVSSATIPKDGVAVEFVSGKKAQVLVVVVVTRTIGTTTDSLRNRARLQLEKVGDRWLVSAVNQVG
jgi:Mce-associated membrane protein